MQPPDLEERLVDFAVRIIYVVDAMLGICSDFNNHHSPNINPILFVDARIDDCRIAIVEGRKKERTGTKPPDLEERF